MLFYVQDFDGPSNDELSGAVQKSFPEFQTIRYVVQAMSKLAVNVQHRIKHSYRLVFCCLQIKN